ncbi:hypothetical protein [Helicobacter winghamensis]|uniref:Uncharacterized protein n=1 Tax=Helicobacter winghamensis TaxID=157268 RepID=A0A2N3PL48_9HELI|nr:hypothetical protein [Helicobacter winghamensis]EEO26607.1 hypothetical protein HWAG_01399 [Helicobacter winghamensis ATCC BAA-430]PKT79213.1 hypothetical protein BCM34_06600 [Helicobacter winghamensis]PKT79342.1 hypothetical protein BCM32_06175 [Helicobacter winghamensis]PKT79417.1 hypothetical protein BCM35_06590 [Helicobacter winghamensis]PKT82433.1 hypothetical protein BCM31_04285 [Helicobacter winghamensis]
MLRESYDLGTLISAVITFMIVVLAIRFALYFANRKGSQIQKPDWLDDERFEVKKKKNKR